MRRILKNLCLLFLLVSISCQGTSYHPQLWGSGADLGSWHVWGISSDGSYLGTSPHLKGSFIWDPKLGLSPIDDVSVERGSPEGFVGRSSKDWTTYVFGTKNGKIQEIGYLQIKKDGLPLINHFTALNRQGYIGGYYTPNANEEPKPFLWKNGIFTDISSEEAFMSQFRSQGIFPTNFQIQAINDVGNFAGTFRPMLGSPLRPKFVPGPVTPFVVVDGVLNILSVNCLDKTESGFYVKKINNNNTVIIESHDDTYSHVYVWTYKDKVEKLSRARALDLNNQDEVLAMQSVNSENSYDRPIVWRKSCISPIDAGIPFKSYVEHSSYHPDGSFDCILELLSINDDGEIFGTGSVWGEKHPIKLTPMN